MSFTVWAVTSRKLTLASTPAVEDASSIPFPPFSGLLVGVFQCTSRRFARVVSSAAHAPPIALFTEVPRSREFSGVHIQDPAYPRSYKVRRDRYHRSSIYRTSLHLE
jgi:hypothetical protein